MDDDRVRLAEGLLRCLRRHDPTVERLDDLRPLTGGASQELWALTACTETRTRVPLVLRRARDWHDAGDAPGAGMRAEAAVLRAAAQAGVPVPGVLAELSEADGLGEGYVMRHVAGETAGARILGDAAFAQVRPRLLDECAAILARIHAVAPARLPALPIGQGAGQLAYWRQRHEANGVARPVFTYALNWLARHVPPPLAQPRLVHGDFRMGNLMVGLDGVAAVLDWELTHLGDPAEDLGWFCVNAWRFGHVARPAGGLGSRDAWRAAYRAAGGEPVEPSRLRFWEVLGNLKWGVACDSMGLAWRHGRDRRIERLAIARRVTEVEMDLMALLGEEAA